MNDLELIELVARTDRYAPGTPLPELFGEPIGTLHDIERRAQMDSIERTEVVATPGGEDPKRDRRRGWSGAWLAAAVLIAIVAVVGAVVAFTGSNGEVTTDPTVTTVAPPTTAAGLSEAEALAVADDYFAAFGAGDVDAMLALFADGAEVSGFDQSLEELELLLRWEVAQRTDYMDVECRSLDPELGGGMQVHCEWAADPYLHRAVGAAPASGQSFTADLAADGRITNYVGTPDQAAFNEVDSPFRSWMARNHPQDSGAVRCCGWDSVEESIARGELRVFYADLWAAYLEENGCVWNEPCEP